MRRSVLFAVILSLAAASLLTLAPAPAAAQKKLSVKHICTIDRRYPNDGACWKDTYFQFHSQNQLPYGDFHGVSVADLKTGTTLGFIDLGFNPNFHNSSITFEEEKAARGDRFPLLYASENYAPNGYYKVMVYRILEPWALSVEQMIVLPSPDSLGILYPHAVPDGKSLWIEGYSCDKKETVFLRFDRPAFEAGAVVRMAGEPSRRFSIPRKKVTDQSWCIRKGKFYQVVGVKREAWLRIVDAESGLLEQEFLLQDYGLPYEPEAIFFRGSRLCAAFSTEGRAEIYELQLR